MNAAVSGQLGQAFLFRGTEVFSITVDCVSEKRSSNANYSWTFGNATDVEFLKNTSTKDVVKALELAWNFDRCTQLVLLLASDSDKPSIRRSAANTANEMLSSAETYDSVEKTLYSAQFPDCVKFSDIWPYVEGHEALEELFADLELNQPYIAVLCNSWNELDVSLFDSHKDKEILRRRLVKTGYFRDFAKQSNDRIAFDQTRLLWLTQNQSTCNSRRILSSWLDGIAPGRVRHEISGEEYEGQVGSRSSKNGSVKVPPIERFRHVQKCKPFIYEQIELGNREKAIRYAKDLVDYQLGMNDSPFACKTLCDLAQKAKHCSYFNLQNEFCKWATTVCPDEGWAFCQLADSFVCLGRFDEAAKAFQSAIEYGEGGFGTTGIAHLHRLRGDLLRAEELYKEAILDYPDESSAWYGLAETYRSQRRHTEALEVYAKAIEEFPNNLVGNCGFAAVLTDVGRFIEARQEYESVLLQFGEDAVALSGIADTFAKEGQYKQAIEKYELAVERFPNQPVPLSGLATVKRLIGDYDGAISGFEQGMNRFENDSAFVTGLAETYRFMRQLDKAVETYSLSLQRFPYDARSWAGKANILKIQNLYEQSLQLYDQAIQKFPTHFVILSGRADILKNMGRAQEAIDAYKQLEKAMNQVGSRSVSIAAIESSIGNFDAAKKILGEMPRFAKTEDDWMAHHVYGIVLLRQGKISEAVKVMKIGLKHCRWEKGNRYFRRGLAIAKLKQNQIAAIPEILKSPDTVLDKLILLCATAELGSESENLTSSVLNDCPSHLNSLRESVVETFVYQRRKPSLDALVDNFCIATLTA